MGNKLVLTQWEVLPMEDTTWETLSELQQAYPDLHLEDKVLLQSGRNDTDHIMNTEGQGNVAYLNLIMRFK